MPVTGSHPPSPSSAAYLAGAGPEKLRRTFLMLAGATLLVFGGLLFGLTVKLRARLKADIETRNAEAIHAVALMEVNAAAERFAKLGVTLQTSDVLAAVLESSRLGGVIGVQLFDSAGVLRETLPPIGSDAVGDLSWWPRPLTGAAARFHREGTLEQVFAVPVDSDRDVTRTPLLEVAIPLGRSRGDGSLGVARYWINGEPILAEFRRLDRSLLVQAGTAFAGGAALLVALLLWAYRRLEHAQQRLLEQSRNLARANEELDFAAKTGALGAISAHLIHGLKNPLAGLEGFVADVGSSGPLDHDTRKTALDTARRMRSLVDEVVSVLREEGSGGADYPVPVAEALAAIEARAQPLAERAGVRLVVNDRGAGTISGRTSNLAGLVLVNVLSNAVEASPAGAEVCLGAARNGSNVEFLVTDHGAGLPDNVRESLFRPVRSTKPGGGGMGLAISHRLARHAGGELSLVRSHEAGTVFRLTVPAADHP